MTNHYLLWANGEDRPGIVAAVAKVLFRIGGNLEDSTMMRLGSEFAMYLIFTTEQALSADQRRAMSATLGRHWDLSIGVKPLTSRQAKFTPARKRAIMISVHGPDQPGLVYRV